MIQKYAFSGLWISLFLSLSGIGAQAQHRPELVIIDTLIADLGLSGTVALQLNVDAGELKGAVYQAKSATLAQLRRVEQLLQESPYDRQLQSQYHTLLQKVYPEDSERIAAYATQRVLFLDSLIQHSGAQRGEACYDLAILYLYLGPQELNKAYNAARCATELMPDSAKAWETYGMVFLYAGQYAMATEMFRTALRKEQTDLNALTGLMLVQIFEQLQSLALDQMKAFAIDKSHIQHALNQKPSFALEQLLHFSELMELFYRQMAQMAEMFDKDSLDGFVPDQQYAADLKRLKTFFTQALKQHKAYDASHLHNALGIIEVLQDNQKKAGAAFLKAIQQNPARIGPYDNLVFVYVRQKDYQKAIKLMYQKLENTQKTPTDYSTLAQLYHYQDNISAGIEALQKGINSFQEGASTSKLHYDLALLYAEAKQDDQALSEAKTAYNLNPEDTDTALLYAALALRAGQPERAAPILRRLESSTKEAKQLLKYCE
jgi:tetratricopeptide (TPR) repeat protein